MRDLVTKGVWPLALLAALLLTSGLAGCRYDRDDGYRGPGGRSYEEPYPSATDVHRERAEILLRAPDREVVERIIADWKTTPRQAATDLIARYGPPAEATRTRLVWHGNGPWKRTVVVNEEIAHDFPTRHFDCVEQTIDYRVPPDWFSALADFDGSLIADRTPGEISSRCDREEMNFLALNLANELICGQRSIEEARLFLAEVALAGVHDEYQRGFLFETPRAAQADPDRPLAPMSRPARPPARP